MIVDTSALLAVAIGEAGWEVIRQALVSEPCVIPAPVLTEMQLALTKHREEVEAGAAALVEVLLAKGATIEAFEARHAAITALARPRYGKGNGQGGKLNFGDLMVYAVTKDRGEPLLCTGGDFATTDLEIHPASRLDL